MATFLQLVQRLQRRTSTGGNSAISDVTAVSGDQLRLVEYVRDAWTEIQSSRPDWKFQWAEFSKSLTAGTTDYNLQVIIGSTPRIPITRLLLVKDSDTTQRRIIQLLTKDYFDQLFAQNLGVQVAGFPLYACLLPDMATIRFNCPLDLAYTLSGNYYIADQTLSVNSDTPTLPARYHDAIFYRALVKFAEYEEANDIYITAKRTDDDWQQKLSVDLVPKVFAGGDPLA